eukprot:scaffold77770_cov48-Phaeocystis_antarctica.AAC.1
MASYTVILLKNVAARPGGEGFSLQRGEAKNLRVAKMKFRSSARPDLRITQWPTAPRGRPKRLNQAFSPRPKTFLQKGLFAPRADQSC